MPILEGFQATAPLPNTQLVSGTRNRAPYREPPSALKAMNPVGIGRNVVFNPRGKSVVQIDGLRDRFMESILLLNAGSSSLKGLLVDADGRVVARGTADWAGVATRYQYVGPDLQEHAAEEVHWQGHAAAVRRVTQDLMHAQPIALPERHALAAVGHRIVHGGEFASSVRITPAVRSRIAALAELAPLHNPPSLEALAAAEAEFPGVSHVAVFDTAFHSTLPAFAHIYPLPARWTNDWGIRRFGFHGLSHAYCARRAAEMLGGRADKLRLVICHLGHGCSASAVVGGRCVDTTMGFTPLDGLMMATRSGAIDPSIVLHVQQRRGLTPDEIETALNRESGLLGVSEISGDMRLVLAAAAEGHAPAQLALGIYAHRVRQAIGALSVTMGGIDALVFTAGVGEHAPDVRATICSGLECLGVEMDTTANSVCLPDSDIGSVRSRARILVISTREDITMFQEVMEVLHCEGAAQVTPRKL